MTEFQAAVGCVQLGKFPDILDARKRVARAYLDQLQRGGVLSESAVAEVAAALDRSALQLEGGARDEDLAAELESLAAALEEGSGDVIAEKRQAALAGTLGGIAAGLR